MLNKNNRSYKHAKNLKAAQGERPVKIPTNPQYLLQPLLTLYIDFIKERPAAKLLTLLFFTLPWGLGKHFENVQSFVDGKPLSYLIPAVYLQDIIALAVIVLEVAFIARGVATPNLLDSLRRPVLRLFFLFLLSVFLSVFFAGRFYPSAYFFERLLLYFLFCLVSINLFRAPSVRRWFFVSIGVNVLLLSTLGFLQFYGQASVFNNYLFFGEQPYTVFTPFIAKESFNGVVMIPPYATFLHPNIFAGYLAVSLTLVLGYFWDKGKHSFIPLVFFTVLVSVVLFLAKSYTSWAAFVLGLLLVLFVRLVKSIRLVRLTLFILALTIILAGLLLPFYKRRAAMLLPADSTTSALSIERRSALLEASYKMLVQKPFFGWGINSFTYNFKPFYSFKEGVIFSQPVHNVFALVAAETGLVGAVLFIVLALYSLVRISRPGNYVYSISLVQIIFLAGFDHYFFTILQTQLLFILTLMMGLTYTKKDNCL